MPGAHETAHHIRPHPAQSNHSNFHIVSVSCHIASISRPRVANCCPSPQFMAFVLPLMLLELTAMNLLLPS
jgi:hypothetical protein